MKHYLGVKMIEAEPMSRQEFEDSYQSDRPHEEKPDQLGYHVRYLNPDGKPYDSWSPKQVFESAYLPLEGESTITQKDVDLFTNEVIATNLQDGKSTLVQAETLTGFRQYEVSSCVDPKNYDPELGKSIGAKRIKDKIWGHLGFVLQWAKFGLTVTAD